MRQNLEFRGSSTVLFGDILVTALLSIITLGIYAPWGYVRIRRKILDNTYYHEEPLQFDGTGGELFGIAIKGFLLSLVTLGIYALLCFPIVAILKWDTESTVLPNGKRLEYRGTALDYFGQMIVVALLSAITLGIYSFWGFVKLRQHVLTNTVVDGMPLQFTGTGGQYFGVAIVSGLFTMVTLGIYGLLGCAMVRQLRWDTENTVLPVLPSAPGPLPTGDGERPIQVNVTVNR